MKAFRTLGPVLLKHHRVEHAGNCKAEHRVFDCQIRLSPAVRVTCWRDVTYRCASAKLMCGLATRVHKHQTFAFRQKQLDHMTCTLARWYLTKVEMSAYGTGFDLMTPAGPSPRQAAATSLTAAC